MNTLSRITAMAADLTTPLIFRVMEISLLLGISAEQATNLVAWINKYLALNDNGGLGHGMGVRPAPVPVQIPSVELRVEVVS